MICFLQLYSSFYIICSVGLHICHSVWPSTTSESCLREAVRVESNSDRGRRLALGPQTKQGAPHCKRVPGPQKVYFNHCQFITLLLNIILRLGLLWLGLWYFINFDNFIPAYPCFTSAPDWSIHGCRR